MLGDLNGWIGDRVKAGITGTSGVPEENENGEWAKRVSDKFMESRRCFEERDR